MTDEQADSETRIQASSLRADEPIRSNEDDRLSRGPLVDMIARHILSMDGSESVVIALNAPWGAGKSSFLNLLEDHLTNNGDSDNFRTDGPIVVRFNPWHFGNVDQLVRVFFAELSRGIGTRGKTRRKIGQLLTTFGSIVSAASSIAPVAGGAGAVMQRVGTLLDTEENLHQAKTELDGLLTDLDQRVIVFVDDIDRLEPDVTRLLFRMVRLNANLPNVTYVLAFDRLVVERNLNENGVRGRDYLEKIVQVSFDIPQPEPDAIYRILLAELSALIQTLETRPVDMHRWGNLFLSGFRDHFRTIRHVKRYVNGLRFTLPLVAQEVDAVDFLGVELIRTFHPEVYVEMVESTEMLAFSTVGEHTAPEEIRKRTKCLCGKASDGLHQSVKKLLIELFPTVAGAYTNIHQNPQDHRWHTKCRVCSPEVFDRFFLLAVPGGDVSEITVRAFLDELADTTKTAQTIRLALKSGTAQRLLERLMDVVDDVPEEHIAPFMQVVSELGDELQFEPQRMYDIAEVLPRHIIWRCLRRISDERERYTILLKAVEDGSSLSTVVETASLARPDGGESGQLLSEDNLWRSIKDAFLKRIRLAAADGSLWRSKKLGAALVCWSAWSSNEEVCAAIDKQVATDERFMDFVGRYERKSFALGGTDKMARPSRVIADGELSSVRDMKAVKQRLEEIASGCGPNAARAGELVPLFLQNHWNVAT